MYVCGITPYDATHLGHAATYVTFDVVGRTLRDAGHDVRLRAEHHRHRRPAPRTRGPGRQGLGRPGPGGDGVVRRGHDRPPGHRPGPLHRRGGVDPVDRQGGRGARGERHRIPAATLPKAGRTSTSTRRSRPHFGEVSHLSHDEMLALFAERGGDPDREGKRDVLDPLLWRARRDGEPSWPGGGLGDGRPGWHIECATIAQQHLGVPFDLQGGGTDLIFPHHEMSAGHGEALSGAEPFARTFVHQAMVGYDGEKMSKSKGNLVLVSELRERGVEPMAIRLALLAHHYRTPWEWTDDVLAQAEDRLATWRAGMSTQRWSRRRRHGGRGASPPRRRPRHPGRARRHRRLGRPISRRGRVRRGRPRHRGTYLRRPARRTGLATRTAQAGGLPSSPRRRR